MQDCKLGKVPIPVGLKLSVDQCPKSKEEIEYMDNVTYASAIGCLMYAMVCTQLDIAHAMGVLSRIMMILGKEHWTTIKRLFIYLRGTIDFSIRYHGNFEDIGVHSFVDFDWPGDINDRRSTSGYVFKLFGGVVSWMSRK